MNAGRWADYPAYYFNQAGSGPARPAARARTQAVDDRLAALGGHSAAGLEYGDETLEAARRAIAHALGLPADWSVSFCQSATEALNLLAEGIPRRRARLAASDQEHPSGLLSLAVRQDRGFQLDVIPMGPRDAWAERIIRARSYADLVVLSSVSYWTGWRLPVEQLDPPRATDGLLVIDLSQALGQVDVSHTWGVADAAVGLGHKWLHGPLPTGFLLASPRARDRLRVPRGGWHARDSSRGFDACWRVDGRRFEPGSMDAGRIAGLQVAVEMIGELGSDTALANVRRWRHQVVEVLDQVGYPALSDSVDGMILVPLREQRSARHTAAAIADLGVTVKDLNAPEVPDRLRISLCAFHQDAEVERLCAALRQVLGQVRPTSPSADRTGR